MTPKRFQLRRTKGWRLPPNTVSVARPGPYGNPFSWRGDWITWAAIALGYRGDEAGRRAASVALHRAWMTDTAPEPGPQAKSDDGGTLEYADGTSISLGVHVRQVAAGIAGLLDGALVLPERPDLSPLRGSNVACFCALDELCHGDTVLELANRPILDPEPTENTR